MNISVLENIKLVENDHTLKILVINTGIVISPQSILQLKNIGEVTIAVDNTIESSWLVGQLGGVRMRVVLRSRIPIDNYDILISNCLSDTERIILRSIKIKYLCFTQFVRNFNLANYYAFEENSYKLTINNVSHPHHGMRPPCPPPPSQNNESEEPQSSTENDESNYEIIIKDIASTETKYDKYFLNYLHPVIPGKISIIMIVSELNNNFADVVRDIKAQNLPSYEIIIIDNAAGFRNNVKPDIRYGTKMPKDYCEYHAKELTSGEYIIMLDQDSASFDVMTAINQGQYETR